MSSADQRSGKKSPEQILAEVRQRESEAAEAKARSSAAQARLDRLYAACHGASYDDARYESENGQQPRFDAQFCEAWAAHVHALAKVLKADGWWPRVEIALSADDQGQYVLALLEAALKDDLGRTAGLLEAACKQKRGMEGAVGWLRAGLYLALAQGTADDAAPERREETFHDLAFGFLYGSEDCLPPTRSDGYEGDPYLTEVDYAHLCAQARSALPWLTARDWWDAENSVRAVYLRKAREAKEGVLRNDPLTPASSGVNPEANPHVRAFAAITLKLVQAIRDVFPVEHNAWEKAGEDEREAIKPFLALLPRFARCWWVPVENGWQTIEPGDDKPQALNAMIRLWHEVFQHYEWGIGVFMTGRLDRRKSRWVWPAVPVIASRILDELEKTAQEVVGFQLRDSCPAQGAELGQAKIGGGEHSSVADALGAEGAVNGKPGQRRGPKEPSETDFQIYRYWIATGKKQTEMAVDPELMELLGRRVDQGSISRTLTRVTRWIEAGNVLPAMLNNSRTKPEPIDPALIDLGERSDGRAKHQRNRRTSSGDD